MKKIAILIALAPMVALAKTSTPAGFTDNLDEAFAAAKASGKYVYACFSGSDWCGWCKRLDKEVFAHREFLDGVTNDYVLVFIDNPSNQDLLSERAKQENPKLTEKYGIEGFPSALVLTSDGETIAKTGYRKGGPVSYAKYLMDVRKDGPALKQREQAAKEFLRPYKDRVGTMMKTLRDECNEAMKGPAAKAKAELARIIADFEAAKAPEGTSDMRDEYLEELNNMKKMFESED